MAVEWIPQACAILLAAGGAITDLLRGKVYNRWILFGLVMAGTWLVLTTVWSTFGGISEYRKYPQLGQWSFRAPPPLPKPKSEMAPWESAHEVSVMPTGNQPWPDWRPPEEPAFWVYGVKVLLNASLALLAGFVLWWFGLWAAGDAKLFGTLALLLPLSTYHEAYMAIFPAYVLLFNTFFAVMAILVLEMLGRTVRQAVRPTKDESRAWRESLLWIRSNTGRLLLGFVGLLFLFLCIMTLRKIFRDSMAEYTALENKPLMFLLLFLVFMPIAKAMKRAWIGIPIVVGTMAWIGFVAVYPTEDYNLKMVFSMGSLALTLILFYLLYSIYLNVFDFKAIKIWELKPRMILSKRTLEVLKEDEDLLGHKMGSVGADGLHAAQAETLRRWWIDRGKGGVIWVSRTMPFAPALLVGTVLTVLLGDYVVWT